MLQCFSIKMRLRVFVKGYLKLVKRERVYNHVFLKFISKNDQIEQFELV